MMSLQCCWVDDFVTNLRCRGVDGVALQDGDGAAGAFPGGLPAAEGGALQEGGRAGVHPGAAVPGPVQLGQLHEGVRGPAGTGAPNGQHSGPAPADHRHPQTGR